MPTEALTPANDNAASACWVDALIGNALRQRRLELGMGQGELAAKAGTPLSHIERYESGAWRIPSATLIRMADALQSPLNEFLKAI
jgi:transcriptional regulator with XRE-family HTH domain